jgi:hypothetical protein
MHDMTAIKFRVDPDGKPQLAHRGLDQWSVRNGRNEIAAHANEHLGPPVDDRLHCISNGMAVRTRRIEAKIPS